MSKIGRIFTLRLAAALTVQLAALAAIADEQATTRVTGRVFVADTKEPVPGAKVTATFDQSAWADRWEVRDDVTDNAGYFEIAVPPGHGFINWPSLPPGYWMEISYMPNYATTVEVPVATRDFAVRRGILWKVRVRDGSTGAACRGSAVSLAQFGEKRQLSILREVGATGLADLTVPSDGGEFTLVCGHPNGEFKALPTAQLHVDDGFLPDRVVNAEEDAKSGTWKFLDRAGRAARLSGAKAVLTDATIELQFTLTRAEVAAKGTVVGVVVDEKKQPIEGADVALAFADPNGMHALSYRYPFRATTDSKGRFSIAGVPDRHTAYDNRPMRAVIYAKKRGYGAAETPAFDFRISEPPQTAPTAILKLATPVKVQVVDGEGNALAGAWITSPRVGAVSRFIFAKTDGQGHCTLDQLPPGVHKLEAYHGEQVGAGNVVVNREPVDVTLRLKAPLRPTPPLGDGRPIAEPPQVDPLKPGVEAPEWTIAEWTDGKARRLADFRGKVMVLDFWGVWCGPCLQTIPAMKTLEEKYRDRDVIFLGIHTAGTEMSQVRELLKLEDWRIPTGLDTGTEITQGTTVARYGIRGYPTLIVIDRQGKVVSNTSADEARGDEERVKRKMQQAADALCLPWPIDENATREELRARFTKIQVYLHSEAIDAALKDR